MTISKTYTDPYKIRPTGTAIYNYIKDRINLDEITIGPLSGQYINTAAGQQLSNMFFILYHTTNNQSDGFGQPIKIDVGIYPGQITISGLLYNNTIGPLEHRFIILRLADPDSLTELMELIYMMAYRKTNRADEPRPPR